MSNKEKIETPESGIHFDVPFEDYLQWDAVSNSRLKLASRSLAHYKAGFQGNSDSPALRFGSLVHAGRLEPNTIGERYAVMPDFKNDPRNTDKNGNRSYYKTSWVTEQQDLWRKANQGRQEVSQKEYDDMLGIVKGLCGNQDALAALGGPGHVEASILWRDRLTGLLCKARFDKLNSLHGLFADLKTTQDAADFEKHLINFGYHRQCAFYQDGFETLTGEKLTPWLVAVDKSSPFLSRAAPVFEDLLIEGRAEYCHDIQLVADAKVAGEYPGYENPTVWDGPEWYVRKRENAPIEVTIGGEKVII